ncbi:MULTISPECIES: SMP-30/gluconolactonase/LRE family protein [Streptomyces]|uniref:Superoxide dismutase n=1 Tax=Streptomyces lycii TaxID=2654337 RepID=A0ABQ7FGS6_9ACTN|nr:MULTISPECIES: superoxide dismutase [Streptomyces]KAF4406864.1 superoxide dismutase [Streptomyces lycii]PGH47748.1 superoxide dismutase [Streptomyces sp. Ru87]
MTPRTTAPTRTLPSRRTVLRGAVVAALATGAGASAATGASAGDLASGRWPTGFPLPDGFLPEGITIGGGPYAYMGSRANGAVLRTDLRTGRGRVLHRGTDGTAAIGLKIDRDGLLHVAGGAGGTAALIDSRTGALLERRRLTDPSGHFVNDVVLHGDRAWFTDSRDAVLYGVPRGRTGGEVRRLPLTGDWVQTPDVNNANGIVSAPHGRGLIVVSSTPGRLYHVDPESGHATELTLIGAEDVANGDGLVRVGRTLYVVQNRLNLIAVFELDGHHTATLRRTITDPRFDVPTTAARWRDRLYLVNARFTSPQLPDTAFDAVAVPA